MEDCLFCMIAEGKIPSKKLYEDDEVVAFYDINPQAKVHFLVVPRKHISSAAVLTEEDGALLGHIFTVIAKLAKEQGSFDTRADVLSPVSTGVRPRRQPPLWRCWAIPPKRFPLPSRVWTRRCLWRRSSELP